MEKHAQSKTDESELEKEKLALFDSYMERMLARRVKIDRLETELKSLESYVDSEKYESRERECFRSIQKTAFKKQTLNCI